MTALDLAPIRERADRMGAAIRRCDETPGPAANAVYMGAATFAGRDVPALLAEVDRLRAELTRMADLAEAAIPEYLAVGSEAGDEVAEVHRAYVRQLRRLAGGNR